MKFNKAKKSKKLNLLKLDPSAERVLARQLSREITVEESKQTSGGDGEWTCGWTNTRKVQGWDCGN